MQTLRLGDAELKYDVVGSGEPLLLIHGAFIADAFYSLMAEPRISGRYRVIHYHRRGYAESSRAPVPFPIRDQAADAQALLRHLGISRAHVAGHSLGGVIAIQLALDAPDVIASLALLEPGLVFLVPSAPMFRELMAGLRATYRDGDRVGALEAFLSEVVGPGYREVIREFLPQGAFDLAVADAQTFFDVELEAMKEWRFTAEDAARIRQPVCSVLGAESGAISLEVQSLLRRWIPQTEELVVPQARHALQLMNPKAVAEGMASFLERHRP
jgi:pimeloyl-ACP methyl ester carboxylesterase